MIEYTCDDGENTCSFQNILISDETKRTIPLMSENFISLHPWCAVISEWNNTDDEEARNKSGIVSATGIPYQNNEGPLQRDEVKATFNKEENNDNARKSTTRVGFLLLLHRRAPLVIFHVISSLLPSLPDFSTFSLFRVCKLRKLNADHERPFSLSLVRFFSLLFHSFLLFTIVLRDLSSRNDPLSVDLLKRKKQRKKKEEEERIKFRSSTTSRLDNF